MHTQGTEEKTTTMAQFMFDVMNFLMHFACRFSSDRRHRRDHGPQWVNLIFFVETVKCTRAQTRSRPTPTFDVMIFPRLHGCIRANANTKRAHAAAIELGIYNFSVVVFFFFHLSRDPGAVVVACSGATATAVVHVLWFFRAQKIRANTHFFSVRVHVLVVRVRHKTVFIYSYWRTVHNGDSIVVLRPETWDPTVDRMNVIWFLFLMHISSTQFARTATMHAVSSRSGSGRARIFMANTIDVGVLIIVFMLQTGTSQPAVPWYG